MKDRDLISYADDRQCFVLFPTEIDELMAFTDSPRRDMWVNHALTYHYLYERRLGFSHQEALELTQKQIPVYQKQLLQA